MSNEVKLCKLENGLIDPCVSLAEVTSDYDGHHKKGMSILPISNRRLEVVKHYLIVKNGKFQKNGLLCLFCPFCGERVYEPEATQEAGQDNG